MNEQDRRAWYALLTALVLLAGCLAVVLADGWRYIYIFP